MHRRVFIFFSRVLWYTIVYFEKTLPKEVLKMKAHIARNQNAGVPLALGWNLSPADRGKLEETVAYVKERKQFGRAIAAFQNTLFELAEMKARVEAAKYLVYAAALKKQQAMDGAKVRYSVEAAQAKLIAARTASDVTRRCLQLFGGYGYTRDYPIERMMRDAKITEIYEGTSEVQMMVISGALLK